jgi:hypothetical protein
MLVQAHKVDAVATVVTVDMVMAVAMVDTEVYAEAAVVDAGAMAVGSVVSLSRTRLSNSSSGRLTWRVSTVAVTRVVLAQCLCKHFDLEEQILHVLCPSNKVEQFVDGDG